MIFFILGVLTMETATRDVLQDLQSALDRMKNPVTKQWRDLTGALILVNSLEVLRATAFSTCEGRQEMKDTF